MRNMAIGKRKHGFSVARVREKRETRVEGECSGKRVEDKERAGEGGRRRKRRDEIGQASVSKQN